MRGLEKNLIERGQTLFTMDGHRDSMKESAKGPILRKYRGRVEVLNLPPGLLASFLLIEPLPVEL